MSKLTRRFQFIRHAGSLFCLLASLLLTGCAANDDVPKDVNRGWTNGSGFNQPDAHPIRQGLLPRDFYDKRPEK